MIDRKTYDKLLNSFRPTTTTLGRYHSCSKDNQMRCLSIRQPWAWLICARRKTIENRVWQTPYRGTIAIHASTNKSDVSRLRKSLETDAFDVGGFEYGAIIGFADIVDVKPYGPEHEQDGFASGPYCFRLANAKFLSEPIPMLGKLNLFVLDDEMASRLQAAETYQADLASETREAAIADAFVFETDPVATYASVVEQLDGKLNDDELYAMCTRMIELEPDGHLGYLSRVILALNSGLDTSLQADAEAMLGLAPDNLDVIAYGSDAFMMLEDYARAKTLSDKLIEAHPEEYGFLLAHSRALFELGDVDLAKLELVLALEKLTEKLMCGECHLILARIAISEGRVSDADACLRQAKECGCVHAAVHCIEARIAMARGDSATALGCVQQVMAVTPTNREAVRLLTEVEAMARS